MENQENNSIIKLAIFCFKYSLIIGSLFFLSSFIVRNEVIPIFGLFYVCLAVVVNLFVLLALLITLITTSGKRIPIVNAMGLLLVNVPIALFYFWFLIEYPSIFNS